MPLNNFGIVTENLLRCGQPDLRGVADLADLAVTTIFKLNSDAATDEAEWCRLKGIQLAYSPIPTLTNTADVIRALVGRVQAALVAGARVVVHCEHGRDRTGLVIGAWQLIYQNLTLETVNEERAAFGVTGLFTIFDAQITALLTEIANQGGN